MLRSAECKRFAEADAVASPENGSCVFFIRMVRVSIGRTRELHQNFKPDRIPVIIRALRRDTVEVPSGRYPAVVVRPFIRARGICR
ncbi:MAG: hypothetical protein JWL95_1749 [Gemmatimonadetes bacterium]|nr:hypothetical protein [Gemmatimonadota bacterium]